VVFEKVRRAIEVAGVHFEWLENVFIEVDFEVVAAEALNDLAKEDIAEV